jgi:hypothetical protein
MALRKGSPQINPVVQMGQLSARHPSAMVTVKANVLTWVDWISPGPQSREYRVRVTWNGGRPPKVEVLEPVLTPPPGKRLKHVFPDGSLCLHMPYTWDGSMRIADTIIPWTHEWLLFHELYLATGEWLGGGHEFEDAADRSKELESELEATPQSRRRLPR